MQQVTANKPSKTKSPEALLLPGIQWWTIQDLNLLCENKQNSGICEQLFISPLTSSKRINHICRKLGLKVVHSYFSGILGKKLEKA